MSDERKRPAFEPPAELIQRTRYDPGMARPASTVAGAVLVLLRAAAGVLWTAVVVAIWPDLAGSIEWDGAAPTPDALAGAQTAFAAIAGVVIVAEIILAVLILRGWNWPRVLVMTSSALFIGVAFVGWWFSDQVISLETTLLSLALDVLILLALSSRGSAAYARRRERRGSAGPDRSEDG